MKREAPATRRNREPIAAVLSEELPGTGTILEVASGTGEHAISFAGRFADLTWQPTDPDGDALASIEAYRREAGLPNLQAPLMLDASKHEWPVDTADAILCVNMVHISPWAATEGLFAGASALIARGAPLILYGPYREADVETAPSNLSFDQSLKARDPRWGLRQLADVDALAAQNGFARTRRVEMPANNLMLVYRKQ